MALGGSLLLEINYRLATKPELGTRMTLFWVAMDVSRPWPWIVGVALLVGGLYAFRRSWALVEAGWQAASERIAGGGAP